MHYTFFERELAALNVPVEISRVFRITRMGCVVPNVHVLWGFNLILNIKKNSTAPAFRHLEMHIKKQTFIC